MELSRQFHAPATLPPGNAHEPQYLLNREVGGHQSRVDVSNVTLKKMEQKRS